ncbi:zinc ribbon domain-containing protein, partial [Salmonella enterica]|nr:zinc ribbon domain-containing protein [Salmonella enterica]
RRSVSTLIKKDTLNSLTFNLPKCSACGKDRINTTQKFCHNCGAELISASTFEQCMSLPLHDVPGLTNWQISKIKNEISKFKNIGDFLSSQDPSKELRKAQRIGVVRAEKIINLVLGYVDEFLQ